MALRNSLYTVYSLPKSLHLENMVEHLADNEANISANININANLKDNCETLEKKKHYNILPTEHMAVFCIGDRGG